MNNTAFGTSCFEASRSEYEGETGSAGPNRAWLLVLPSVIVIVMLALWFSPGEAPQLSSDGLIYVDGQAVSLLSGDEPVLIEGVISGHVAAIEVAETGQRAALAIESEVLRRLSANTIARVSTANEWIPGNPVVILSPPSEPSGSALERGASIRLEGAMLSVFPAKFWLIASCSTVAFVGLVFWSFRSLQRVTAVVRLIQALLGASIAGIWLYVLALRFIL